MEEDELQQNTTTVTKRIVEVLPATKIAHKKQQGVPVDKIVADLHPDLTAKEATIKVEMDQTEAEDLPNLRQEEGGFPKKSNA